MTARPELETVEQPFIDQLVGLGWKHTTGNLDFSSATGRESFREVLLLDDLRKALWRINLDDDGKEWLDDGRVGQAVSALDRLGAPKLMEGNHLATELLHKGTSVEGVSDWDHGRAQTVRYIDWDHPEKNTFRVVNQFRVDEPRGQAKQFIAPDIVLFANEPAAPAPVEGPCGVSRCDRRAPGRGAIAARHQPRRHA